MSHRITRDHVLDEYHDHRATAPVPLGCGHPDDDPTSWHENGNGDLVCSACCAHCQPLPLDLPAKETTQ